jgi:hypothetical protein
MDPPDPCLSEHALSPKDPFDLLVAKRRVDGLYAALAKLNERDADVVRRRAGLGREPQTLAAVGADLGLTSERVRQLQLRALSRLKALMTPPPPKPRLRLRVQWPAPEPPRRRRRVAPPRAKVPLAPERPPGTQNVQHYYLDGLSGLAEDLKRREVKVRVCRSLKQPTNPIKNYVLAVFRACHAEGLATLDGDDLHDFFRWRDNDLPLWDLARVVEKLVRTGSLYADLDLPLWGNVHQWFGACDFALWREPLRALKK